jgi:hypothetical protein
MRSVPHNLQSAYFKLKKSKLIKENDLSIESLAYFELILNSSLPKKENDNIIYYFIKNMFYNDKYKFYNFINNSEFECLVLYTDNLTISKHFNLFNKIYIKWDSELKVYKIVKLISQDNNLLPVLN